MRLWGCVTISALAAVLALGGCSAWQPDHDLAAWIDHNPAAWQLSPSTSIHRSGTLATTRPADADEPIVPGAGAEDYVRVALQRNASIRAAEADVRRLEARIPQASSLDDPMLEVAPVGEMAQTAAGEVGVMTGISQKLPFPGKLQTRGRIAAQDAAIARADLKQTRVNVAADVRQAYWSYYFATRAIEVTQQSRDLLAQFQQAAQARYKANLASQQDVLRASVELSNLDNELITLQQGRTTAVAMLNSLLDRPVTDALPVPQPVPLRQVDLQLDDVLAEAARDNPELGKIDQQIEAGRQRLNLARLQRWPDLTVGLTYNFVDAHGLSMAANGKDQWWLSFGVSLPIWFDKLRAGEREAYAGIQQGIADLTAARDQIAFKVQDALVRVQTQQRLVVLLGDVIVPQARQALDASASSYQAGKIDFLTVVDNWRKLLNYQLLYHQSLAEMQKDYAQLQQAVGRE